MSLELLVKTFGYWALFVGTFLEGETILIICGFFAHRGYLELAWVIVVAFMGSLAGD
jgi:membrane protein DedA with SNARE-associated domain